MARTRVIIDLEYDPRIITEAELRAVYRDGENVSPDGGVTIESVAFLLPLSRSDTVTDHPSPPTETEPRA